MLLRFYHWNIQVNIPLGGLRQIDKVSLRCRMLESKGPSFWDGLSRSDQPIPNDLQPDQISEKCIKEAISLRFNLKRPFPTKKGWATISFLYQWTANDIQLPTILVRCRGDIEDYCSSAENQCKAMFKVPTYGTNLEPLLLVFPAVVGEIEYAPFAFLWMSGCIASWK